MNRVNLTSAWILIAIFLSLPSSGTALEDPLEVSDLPEANPSLTESAGFVRTPDANVLVLRYGDFVNALEERQEAVSRDDVFVQERVDRIESAAAEPGAIGLASWGTEVRFSGDLFIVPLDPATNGSGGIEFQHYFTASVELSGSASWVGDGVSVLSAPFPDPDACCEACEADGGIGHPTPGDGAGDGGGGCGPTMDVLICQLYDISPSDFPALAEARDFSEIVRGLLNDGGVVVDGEEYDASSVAPEDECEYCRVVDALPAQCDKYGPLDPVEDSNTGLCGGGGTRVPDWCLSASFPGGQMPPECGGLDPSSVAEHFAALHGCNSSGPTPQASSLAVPEAPGGLPKGPCATNVPELCQLVSPGENGTLPSACDSTSFDSTRFWMEQVGCGSNPNLGSGSPDTDPFPSVSCCGEFCACLELDDGTRLCEQCNSDGVCHTSTERSFFDPRVAQDDSEQGYGGSGEDNPDTNPEDWEPMTLNEAARTGKKFVVKRDGDWVCVWNCNAARIENGYTVSEDVGSTNRRGPSEYRIRGRDERNDKASRSDTTTAEDENSAEDTSSSGSKTTVAEADDEGGSAIGGKDGEDDDSRGSDDGKADEGDPVILANGNLLLKYTDLQFPGAVQDLRFERRYSSSGGERGVLGSNWTHNFESRLEFLTPGSAPDWAPGYCNDSHPISTCIIHHQSDGATALYYYDFSHRIYKPQAGSTRAIKPACMPVGDSGEDAGDLDPSEIASCPSDRRIWQVIQPNGYTRIFNDSGYLTSEYDRHGNGVSVEYEPTPLYTLYRRYCTRVDAVTYCDEPEASATLDNCVDRRLCWAMGHVFDDARDPRRLGAHSSTTDLANAEFPAVNSETVRFEHEPEWRLPDLPDSLDYLEWLSRSQAYAEALAREGALFHSPTGAVRYRPAKVVDDIGRALEFEYENEPLLPNGHSNPEFGLLRRVHGVGRTSIEFDYARDPSHPAELNESFLVSATRERGRFSSRRNHIYEYGWSTSDVPGYGSSWSQTVDNMALAYDSAYYEYFTNLHSCVARYPTTGGNNCSDIAGNKVFRRGDPCTLADMQTWDYRGAVSDNVVRVRHNGIIESETEYEVDPHDENYDRAMSQRFGGTETQSAGQGWESGYPTFTFDYYEPGFDLAHLDRTSGHLPQAIQERYPLESTPSSDEYWDRFVDKINAFIAYGADSYDWSQIPPRGDVCPSIILGELESEPDEEVVQEEDMGSCWLGHPDGIVSILPGYRLTLPYFDVQESQSERTRIRRSRLTCDQLATVQVGDPLHNATFVAAREAAQDPDPWNCQEFDQSSYVPNTLEQSYTDGDIDCNTLARIYNCTDESTTGQALNSEAHTVYEAVDDYDYETDTPLRRCDHDITSHLPPSNDVDEPIYEYFVEAEGRDRVARNANRICRWAKVVDRDGNERWYGLNYLGKSLVEAVVAAEATDGFIFTETVYNADGNAVETREPVAGTSGLAAGYTELRYEEVVPTTPEALEQNPDHWSKRNNLLEVRRVAESPVNRLDESGATRSVSEEVTMTVYGGDYNQPLLMSRFVGGPSFVDYYEELHRVVYDYRDDGQTLRTMTTFDPDVPTSARTTSFEWAPHGAPKSIVQPDGYTVRYEYHVGTGPSSNGRLQTSSMPSGTDTSGDNRGLLARIVRDRHDLGYPATVDSLPQNPGVPCDTSLGPYAWLGADNCQIGLADLGLAADLVREIQETRLDKQDVTELLYDETGHVSHRWGNGRETYYDRDSDGRVHRRIDPDGAETVINRNLMGWPISESTERNGEITSEIVRRFDDVGRLTARCEALEPGGCVGNLSSGTALGHISDQAPHDEQTTDHRIWVYEYSGEGYVSAVSVPSGVTTRYTRNSRSQVEAVLVTDPLSGDIRLESYTYDDQGRLVAEFDGTAGAQDTGGDVLSTRYWYNGFDYPHLSSDRRGKKWSRYRDLAGRTSQVSHVDSGRTVSFERNTHGEVTRETRTEPGSTSHTVEYIRTADGRLVGVKERGMGDRWVTFDARGRPVWVRDGEGNMTVSTYDPAERTRTSAKIRVGETGQVLSTSAVTDLDINLLPVSRTLYGHDGTLKRSWIWRRNEGGFVERSTNPEGVSTTFARNLSGWESLVERETTEGTDVISRSHTPWGDVATVEDPKGEKTRYVYNGYGQLLERYQEPIAAPMETREYDTLGRLIERTRARGGSVPYVELGFEYDSATGDLSSTRWRNAPSSVTGNTLAEYSYDQLGRVTRATRYNLQLQALGLPGPSSDFEVQTGTTYDVMGRTTLESIRVGTGGQKTTDSRFNVVGGHWQRHVSYPLESGANRNRTELRRDFDGAGRVEFVSGSIDGRPIDVAFDWMGDVYAGSTHWWSADSTRDPLEEVRLLDALAQASEWDVRVVDTDAVGGSSDAVWKSEYCTTQTGASRCQGPLLNMHASRDVMGRIASLNWTFEHAAYDGGGDLLEDHPVTRHWRGYEYDKRGALVGVWEHDTEDPNFSVKPLENANHSVDNAMVVSFGESLDEAQTSAWDYVRESKVGSLESIVNRFDGTEKWAATKERLPGYRLEEIRVDNTTYGVQHNDSGEVTYALGQELVYGPGGRLAAVVDSNGDVLEAYSYDGGGRLSGVFGGGAELKYTFAYDGDQIIAAYGPGDRASWEAAWGTGLDDLLHWSDLERGDAFVPITNHRRSVVATWDVGSERVDELAEYGPHGRLTRSDSVESVVCTEIGKPGQVCENPSGMPFGFTSAFRSSETGLVYLRHRWYSPRLGQFVSQDPLGYVDSYNPYAYVGMDPINSLDPYGLASTGSGERGDTGKPEVRSLGERVKDWVDEGHSNPDAEEGRPEVGRTLVNIIRSLGGDFEHGQPGGSKGGSSWGRPGNPVTEGGWMMDLAIEGAMAAVGLVAKGIKAAKNAVKKGLKRIAEKVGDAAKRASNKARKAISGGGSPDTPTGRNRPNSRQRAGSGDDADSGCTTADCGKNPVCFTAGTPISTPRGLKSIETLETGDRVEQFDGARCSVQPFVDEPDNCAVVTFEFDSPYGYDDTLVVELMRTRDWMALNGVELGAMVELAFSELKVEDAGLVTTVASCPPIERDDACLVTGTFRHLNRDVMEVTFANSDLVIEPTWLHPLWSLDRNGWVRAGKLEPGERLKSEAGPLVVDTVRELPSSHVVYNLEVAGDHKYLVGADGLLSHNNKGCGKTADDLFDGGVPDDPNTSPGKDWEWRGSGDPDSGKGSYYNPKTEESLHPDLEHADPIGPHWDYETSSGEKFRIDLDGNITPKD
jgi:RHS repeat-associated protein